MLSINGKHAVAGNAHGVPAAPTANPKTVHAAVPATVVVDGVVVKVVGQTMEYLMTDPKNREKPVVLIPGMAAAGRLTMLAAREKLGKSTLLAFLVALLSRGADIFGTPVAAARILWIGLEEHLSDAVCRFEEMGADPANIVMVQSLPGATGFRQLAAEVAAHKPAVVVIDSLAAYASHIDDENGATGWTRELQPVAELARISNAAIVFVHHGSKATGAYRGSTAIGAAVDMIVEMTQSPNDPTVRVMTTRGRWRLDSYEIRYDVETREFALTTAPTPEVRQAVTQQELQTAVLEWLALHPAARSEEIREGVTGRAKSIDEALKALVADGRVQNMGRGKGYTVVAPPPSSFPGFDDRAA